MYFSKEELRRLLENLCNGFTLLRMTSLSEDMMRYSLIDKSPQQSLGTGTTTWRYSAGSVSHERNCGGRFCAIP